MRILTDHATENDQYGFSVYSELLVSTIWDAEEDDLPFIIGILGDWGFGKTSLMKMMMKELENDENIKLLWFNSRSRTLTKYFTYMPHSKIPSLNASIKNHKTGYQQGDPIAGQVPSWDR